MNSLKLIRRFSTNLGKQKCNCGKDQKWEHINDMFHTTALCATGIAFTYLLFRKQTS